MNGIHEVTGSIPVRSTNLRSPASVSELRLASQPPRETQVGATQASSRPRRRRLSTVAWRRIPRQAKVDSDCQPQPSLSFVAAARTSR